MSHYDIFHEHFAMNLQQPSTLPTDDVIVHSNCDVIIQQAGNTGTHDQDGSGYINIFRAGILSIYLKSK